MWCDFLIQFSANIASGIILAFIFFALSDYIFKIPKINGQWGVKLTTVKTAYKPYINMVLTYKILIWLEGKNIYGSGEKIEEIVSDSKKEYVGKDRSQIKISGSVLKKYLIRDKIVLHIEEKNGERKSSTIYLLSKSGRNWSGRFYSTIADSEGTVELLRQTPEF